MDNTNENMTEDKDINKNNNGNSDDYEKICFVCRRPESRAGKMIVMPNNIYICQDCMQRTFDSINSSGINYEDMMKMSNMPGMGMFGNFGAMDSDPVPEKQKLKKKKENLAAYQMAAEVMDRVGIHEGNVFKYHQARRNTRNYQVDLETLQYDLLYGKRYSYGESGESPYLRTRMRMGIYDVTLDSIQCISEADHTYYIKGTEFTPSSEIKLNGEWYDTVYILSLIHI